MKLENIKREAIRQSKKANYMFSLGAVIFNRHRIISAGYNRVYSTNGFDHQGVCAELLAIKKAPKELLKGASLLVCRTNKSGTMGMSKPCKCCEKLIKKSKIKEVIYSTPNGWERYSVDD